jgi:hypothetical protein
MEKKVIQILDLGDAVSLAQIGAFIFFSATTISSLSVSSSSKTSFENAYGFALMQFCKAMKGLTQSEPYKIQIKLNLNVYNIKVLGKMQYHNWCNSGLYSRSHGFSLPQQKYFLNYYQSRIEVKIKLWIKNLLSPQQCS